MLPVRRDEPPMAAMSLRMGMKLMTQFIVDNTPKRSKDEK